MSQMSISGAASGLDTASIVNQLVSVQRNQQTLLKTQQGTAQKAADAYKALATSLKSLAEQARGVATTSAWQGTTATSSSASVTVTASGTRAAALAFDVTSVAASHALVSPNTVGSLGSTVVSGGSLTLTRSDGSTLGIPVGTGSLTEVVEAINEAGEGLVANAVQTSPGQYRLQVSASATGADSTFDLTGFTGFSGPLGVLRAGSDAVVRVGTDPATAFDVTSSTNAFADVVPGVSFTVSKLETGVRVSTTVDGSAVADKVGKLVEAANALLADIRTKTAYDTSNKTGGPLAGDGVARSLQQTILGTVAGAGAAGVALTRNGTLTFDRAGFLGAFAADPAAVARGYGARTTFAPAVGVTSPVTAVRAEDSAQAGTYSVLVTGAAAAETWRVDPPGGLVAAGQTITFVRGATNVQYTAGVGETLADTVAGLNTTWAQAGLGVTARVDGAGMLLTADGAGAAQAFSVALGAALGTKVTAGKDVTGFIDAEEAVGTGSVLALQQGSSGAVGLSIDVPVTVAEITATSGSIGSVTYEPGLAQRLLTVVDRATRSTDGLLASAQEGRLRAVKDYQRQIERWDDRLATYRTMVTRQFTAMETAISSLKSATSFLSGLTATTPS